MRNANVTVTVMCDECWNCYSE